MNVTEQPAPAPGAEVRASSAAPLTPQTQVAIDDQGGYFEGGGARQRTKLETAQISLNDCLACSGCVTSAESVLIGMQSIDEVEKALAEKKVCVAAMQV